MGGARVRAVPVNEAHAPPHEQQLSRVVRLVRGALGEDALGAYLYGSAVLGGLKPQSDIDILVVSRRATTAEQRGRLVSGLLSISGRYPRRGAARPIELVILVESALRPWRYPPPKDFHYGEWWRPRFEARELAPWLTVDPDLAVLLTSALRESRVLFGPPLATLVEAVPPGDLERAMLDGLPELIANLEGDASNVLLTLARISLTLATGEIRAKDEAATWLLEQLPEEHRATLVLARDQYVGLEPPGWEHGAERALEAARFLEARIRAQPGVPGRSGA